MGKTKFLLSLALIFASLGILFIWQTQSFGKLHLIFCDVGQGDAILISAGTKQVLVDGGPGTRVLECLDDKLPFWDRTVEMVVLTHPQRDHMEGLIAVLARYDVRRVVTTGVKNETDVFRAWEEAVEKEGAKVHEPSVGDRFELEMGLSLIVLYPSVGQIDQWKVNPPSDLNETSIVMRLDFADPSTLLRPIRQAQGKQAQDRSGQLCAYLTGDIPKEIMETLIDRSCDILKIAHHGSKTGTNEEILERAKPKVAVIQVGKNSFGHPAKEVIDMLDTHGVKVLRNDVSGTIEVDSDDITWDNN